MDNSKIRQNWCWLLDKNEYETIYKSLTPIYTEPLNEIISFFNPEPITQQLGPKNKITVGVICVNDAYDFLKEAWWLLHEAFCYFQHINQVEKNEFLFIPRIYADDTCLRLYSSAEHLSSAIVYILGIDKKKIKSDKNKALAIRLGEYLLRELPSHSLSISISKLISLQQWGAVMTWRNNWVHNKRVIPSESPEYKRHNLWQQPDTTTFKLAIGPKRQTESDHDFVTILKTTRTALNAYVTCFTEITAFLKDYILNDILKGQLIYTLKKENDKSRQVASFRCQLDIKHFEP